MTRFRNRITITLVVALFVIFGVQAAGVVRSNRISEDSRHAARSAEATAAQLRDLLSPNTCYGQLSRHVSDLRTWDIKRSIYNVVKVPPTDPLYPRRPEPPPMLVSPQCRSLYESFLPNLPK